MPKTYGVPVAFLGAPNTEPPAEAVVPAGVNGKCAGTHTTAELVKAGQAGLDFAGNIPGFLSRIRDRQFLTRRPNTGAFTG